MITQQSWTPEHQETLTPGYLEFHRKVVEACVVIGGERHREFFDTQCSYEEEFAKGTDPEQVAADQYDALS